MRCAFEKDGYFRDGEFGSAPAGVCSGTEYIVNTVSCNGHHAVTDMWRYDKIPVGNKGIAYNYAALVNKPKENERALFDYALEAVNALGFRYGPSHTEVMLTAQGPRLIETGARPMGGFFPPDLMRKRLLGLLRNLIHPRTRHFLKSLFLQKSIWSNPFRTKLF